jgi:hypothetical protein
MDLRAKIVARWNLLADQPMIASVSLHRWLFEN